MHTLPESTTALHVRPALVTDVPRLTEMIHALADFHDQAHKCRTSEAILHDQLFGIEPVLRAHVAEVEYGVVGMVLWYRTYSTWDAAPGIHVEDLYVDPEGRGHGAGFALMTTMAKIAVDGGYTRIEGQVLHRNPLRRTLVTHGADQLDAWETFRIDGTDLQSLAAVNVAAPTV